MRADSATYAIYDVTRNQGYVVVGTSHDDTPAFAVTAMFIVVVEQTVAPQNSVVT
jgi:hypothetical protein